MAPAHKLYSGTCIILLCLMPAMATLAAGDTAGLPADATTDQTRGCEETPDGAGKTCIDRFTTRAHATAGGALVAVTLHDEAASGRDLRPVPNTWQENQTSVNVMTVVIAPGVTLGVSTGGSVHTYHSEQPSMGASQRFTYVTLDTPSITRNDGQVAPSYSKATGLSCYEREAFSRCYAYVPNLDPIRINCIDPYTVGDAYVKDLLDCEISEGPGPAMLGQGLLP